MKYLLAMLTFACLFSCKKKNDPPAPPTKTELITSSDWKYDNGGIGDANGNITFDFATTGFVPACSFDNSVRFMSNGQGTGYENANVCPSAPATTNFNWSFSSNETVLNIAGNVVAGLGGQFKIKELSSTKLTLLKDTTVTGFGAVTAIFNLKH